MAATPGPDLDGRRVIARTRAVVRPRARADLLTVDVYGTLWRPSAWTTARDAARAALGDGERLGSLVALRQVQRPRHHYLAQWTATWRVVR